MRFATWNLKQAIAPKKPIADLWRHTATDIDPHVMVFTEAKVPKDGVPSGWTAQWKEGGIGHRRRWGTILAGRGVELRPITHVGSWRRRPFKNSWPAALEAAEVIVAGRSWGAVIGIYGMLVDARGERVGSGRISVPLMLEEVAPIVRAHRNVVVAGDFNIWPNDKPRILDRLGLVDEGPFSAIVVAAGAPVVPPPLVGQLAPGGRLVIPVDDGWGQMLTRIRRAEDGTTTTERLGGCAFVPLTGAHGR